METHKPISRFLPDVVLDGITDPAIRTVGQKLIKHERLEPKDGLACFNTKDLIGLGQIASAVDRAYRLRFSKPGYVPQVVEGVTPGPALHFVTLVPD